jgi:hypothetical protein
MRSLRRSQGSPISPLQCRKTEIPKDSVEPAESELPGRKDFDPDGLAIASEVNHEARLDPPGMMALVSGTTRQVIVRCKRSPVAEYNFKI